MRRDGRATGLMLISFSLFAAFVSYGGAVSSQFSHGACLPAGASNCAALQAGDVLAALGMIGAVVLFIVGIGMVAYAWGLGWARRTPGPVEPPRPRVLVLTPMRVLAAVLSLAVGLVGAASAVTLHTEANVTMDWYNAQCYVPPPVPPACPAAWDAAGTLGGAMWGSVAVFGLGAALGVLLSLPELPPKPHPKWV